MAWALRVRVNHQVEAATPAPVRPADRAVLSTTKSPSEELSSSHRLRAELAAMIRVQSRVTRRKKRRTKLVAKSAGSSGQKSRASRSARGRLASTEAKKASATRKVPTLGWRK